MNESRHPPNQQSILAFMTTEHLTLQIARGAANAEIGNKPRSGAVLDILGSIADRQSTNRSR